MGTKRKVNPEDKQRFFAAIAAGSSITEASRISGVHINTGSRWLAQSKAAKAKLDAAVLAVTKTKSREGGAQYRAYEQDLDESNNLLPAIPHNRLCDEALRGLHDFDFFRKHYLGRVPSPWQVEAAVTLVAMLENPEKEFVVLNVPPGAGKSTLFHDVAVWSIVRNRAIRVMIGSISQAMAKQYSRRIRETLERQQPIHPDPEIVKKGLAVDAQGCLSVDYGRFKPSDKGALWRAEEFVVEQLDGNGLDNKEPTVRAYGIDSEYIGHRADLCLFDDVASVDNAREGNTRDKLLERWDQVAEARVDPAGLLAVVGQRLGSGDLYAHCLNKISYDIDDEDYDGSDMTTPESFAATEPVKSSKYKHIVYKSYYPELDDGPKSRRYDAKPYPEGPLLDPQRLGWKDLSYIRYSNPRTFKVVYQQEDDADDTNLISRVWITGGLGADGVLYQGCIDNDRLPGQVPEGLTPPVISLISVDPSPSQFWGIQWWLYQPATNLRYLIDVERIKLTAEELLGYDTSTGEYSGLLEDWTNRAFSYGYPVSHIVVEVNAAQRFLLAHDFVRKWQSRQMVNIIPHTTHRNKFDEKLGIEALLPPLYRSGAVRLPTMRGNWKTLALVDELTKWSPDKKNGTDLVMANWFAELHFPTVGGIKLPPRQWRPSWMLSGN